MNDSIAAVATMVRVYDLSSYSVNSFGSAGLPTALFDSGKS